MIKKNLNLYICLMLILIFTIGYFIIANKVSYAFSFDEEDALYSSRVKQVLLVSEKYGENNLDLFSDEKDTIYVTVSTLLEKGYLIADDEEGNYKDPRSDVKNLNDMKIRIKKVDGKFETKIIS